MSTTKLYITLCGDFKIGSEFGVVLKKRLNFPNSQETAKFRRCDYQGTSLFYHIFETDVDMSAQPNLYLRICAIANEYHLSFCLYAVNAVADKTNLCVNDEQPFFNPIVKKLFFCEEEKYLIDNRYPTLEALLMEGYSCDQISDFANGNIGKWIDASAASAIYHQYQTEIWKLLTEKIAQAEQDKTYDDLPDIPVDTIKSDRDFKTVLVHFVLVTISKELLENNP